MTRTTTATVAVAADYADAMLTARRAKNWLFILLMLILLLQIAIFFMVRFKVLHLESTYAVANTTTTTTTTTTQASDTTQPAETPTTAAVSTSTPVTRSVSTADVLQYVIPLLDFLGITLVIVLGIVLLLITLIMLVGRLIGVSHVTSAFIWCALLAVLLFPWQSFLVSGGTHDTSSGATTQQISEPAFKIPGVLYTWPELSRDYNFSNSDLKIALLKWTRFAAGPILAVLILLSVQAKSGRGLKFALGEADVQVEVTSPTL